LTARATAPPALASLTKLLTKDTAASLYPLIDFVTDRVAAQDRVGE